MRVNTCISCGIRLAGKGVAFPCPSCGEVMIGRCEACRKVNARYVCPKCGFEGP